MSELNGAWGDSRLSPDFTYHDSKFSCLKGAYTAHVAFAYLISLCGFLCLVTRLWPRVHRAHAWLGRLYIIFMFWGTATSLVIHNTGLPSAVLFSFLWVLGGLSIGWLAIVVHGQIMARAAAAGAQDRIKAAGGVPGGDLAALLAEERGRIAASKGFWARLVSLKALHGALFFTSWMNIVGRVFATRPKLDFYCYTYPVYKQIETPHFQGAGKPVTFVPADDPRFARLPWAKMGSVAWGMALLFGPLLGALLVGAAWSFVAARSARKAAGGRTAPEAGDSGDEAAELAKHTAAVAVEAR